MNLNEINKRSCFWYFRHLISVQLVFNIYICMSTFSYLHLHISHLHIYISGLEASDTQVEYSVIQTFRFLIQILQFLGRLFPEKKTLAISTSSFKWNYFLNTMTVRVIESPLYNYFDVLVLSLTGKTMLTLLIDYSSKQQVSVYNNDCWSFYKPKQ